MSNIKVGIIGGSGLNNPELFEDPLELNVTSPFGNPSDILLQGKISGVECVLLARHGRRHTILPSNVNFRANMWSLKEVGCTHVIVSTACGSLQEKIAPGDFVIIDSFIDRTTKRHQTFHDGGVNSLPGILHLPMDEPFCSRTRKILLETCTSLGFPVHPKGTIVTIEGPRFSTRAESRMFKQWGGDVINMTTVPEVILARELGLCYGAIAMATDYDCWKEGVEPVSVDKVLETFRLNAENATQVLKEAVSKIASQDWTDTINDLQINVEKNVMLPISK